MGPYCNGELESTLYGKLLLLVSLFIASYLKYTFLPSQAIQHIERTQERRASAEEEQRRAVIVSPAHIAMDTACSDTDTDTEGEDSSMN